MEDHVMVVQQQLLVQFGTVLCAPILIYVPNATWMMFMMSLMHLEGKQVVISIGMSAYSRKF